MAKSPASGSGVVDIGGLVAPAMELVYEAGTPDFRGQWPGIEQHLTLSVLRPGSGDWGHPCLELLPETSHPEERAVWTTATTPRSTSVQTGVLHDNVAGRIAALDAAGVELQLISPGPSIDACTRFPPNVAAGLFGAYNTYLINYCEQHPARLGAVLQLHGAEAQWSAREILDRVAESPCVRAASISLQIRVSPDSRHFDPVWEALEEAGLPLLQRRSFSTAVWTPARMLNYLTRAGLLERFPGLRIGFAATDANIGATELVGQALNGSGWAGETGCAFVAATAAQIERDSSAAPGVLWASDFPLVPLDGAVEDIRRALGNSADECLVASPNRFLGPRRG